MSDSTTRNAASQRPPLHHLQLPSTGDEAPTMTGTNMKVPKDNRPRMLINQPCAITISSFKSRQHHMSSRRPNTITKTSTILIGTDEERHSHKQIENQARQICHLNIRGEGESGIRIIRQSITRTNAPTRQQGPISRTNAELRSTKRIRVFIICRTLTYRTSPQEAYVTKRIQSARTKT